MAFKDIVVSRPVAVITPVVSSLAGAVKEYVLSVMPKGYLKDFFIDTELPMYRRMNRRRFRPMTKSQIEIRHLPLLSIRVEVTADPSDFATGTTFWTSGRFLLDPTKLTRLIADDANLLYVGYETERVVVRFQISITVETDLKANEVAMYLRRTLPVGQKFYINDIDIATEIPSNIVRTVWSSLGYGDGSDPAEVDAFRGYLRSATEGNVEQVVNSASGRSVFAYSYRANPLMSITGAPTVSVNRDGNVVRTAQIDLPMEADVMVPVAYGLRAEERLDADATEDRIGPSFLAEEGGIPYFASAVRSRPPETLPGNLQLAFFTSLVTADPDPLDLAAPDVTDFSAVVNAELKDYIVRLLARGDTQMVDALLWLDGNAVDPAAWEFDPTTWTLTILRAAFQPRQKYHFGVYADLADIGKPADRRPQAPSPLLRPV